MANIEFITRLHEKYKHESGLDRTALNEHLQIEDPDTLQKSLRAGRIQLLDEEYDEYFRKGKTAGVFLMFIDVCGFSTRFEDLTGPQISQYFDKYYDIIIPIIYEYGGEIDKIIGDGIIAIFGKPFLNENRGECFVRAEECARKIITSTQGSKHSSKIALHYGPINYFYNKSVHYSEFTIVGKPLTELFRLENVSTNDAINFFEVGVVNNLYGAFLHQPGSNWSGIQLGRIYIDNQNCQWSFGKKKIPPLKGVSEDYSYIITAENIS